MSHSSSAPTTSYRTLPRPLLSLSLLFLPILSLYLQIQCLSSHLSLIFPSYLTFPHTFHIISHFSPFLFLVYSFLSITLTFVGQQKLVKDAFLLPLSALSHQLLIQNFMISRAFTIKAIILPCILVYILSLVSPTTVLLARIISEQVFPTVNHSKYSKMTSYFFSAFISHSCIYISHHHDFFFFFPILKNPVHSLTSVRKHSLSHTFCASGAYIFTITNSLCLYSHTSAVYLIMMQSIFS